MARKLQSFGTKLLKELESFGAGAGYALRR